MANINIQEYIQNNRKQAIGFAAGGVVLLALLVFGLMRLLSPAPPDDTAFDQMAGAPSVPGMPPTQPGMPPTMPGMPPSQPGMPPAMPGMAPSPGGVPGGPPVPGGMAAPADGSVPVDGSGVSADGSIPVNAAGANKTKKKSSPPQFAARTDPFLPLGASPQSKAQLAAARARYLAALKVEQERQMLATLPQLSIWRPKPPQANTPDLPGGLMVTETNPAEPSVVRRMAGILYSDRVLALLDTDGTTDVVKPGDVLERSGQRVRVNTISRDAIVLQRLDGNRGTITVPLKNAPEGSVMGVTPGMPGMPMSPGMPGMPGMPPGGAPRPGMMPGGMP